MSVNDAKKQGKKKPFFLIAMCLYILIFINVIIWGLATLYDFLGVYEKTLPVHAIEAYMDNVNDEYYNSIIGGKIEVNPLPFEKREEILQTYDKLTTVSHSYSFSKKIDEYTDDKPVYLIKADNKAFVKVTFEAGGEREKYDFPVWQVAAEEALVDVSYEANFSVKAVMPDYAVLKINGVEADDSFITNSELEVPMLEKFDEYLDTTPYMKEYSVSGLYCEPTVTACDINGNELECTVNPDGTLYFDFLQSEEMHLEHEEYILAMEKTYISYMINQNGQSHENFRKLDKYLKSGTTIYSYLSGLSVSSNNIYDSREDKLISADNFRKYSDDCFSVDMSFDILLHKGYSENEYSGSLRWVFINFNGEWLAVDMILI